MEKVIRFNDEYIEKMGNFYSSEMVLRICPHIRDIPFYEWLVREYEKQMAS